MTIYVSNEDLFSLLRSEENDTLDFKSADLLMDPNGENFYKIAKHIVGFANHRGGKLIFGVNDNHEPEGKGLLEEESLGTISEINSTQISPSVEFSHSFFSAEQGDLSEGSVFVLEISRNSAPVPCAIVEESEGEIDKREYRIRTGESTRLVSNEELLALFKSRTDPQIEYKDTLRFLLESDYTPADVKYKPRYQHPFDRHFTELGTEENSLIDKLRGEAAHGTDDFQERIIRSQYALTISSILSNPGFLFLSNEGIEDNMNKGSGELSFELKSTEKSDIVLSSESNPLIEKTNMEVPGLLQKSGSSNFRIPEESKITVNEDFDGFDIHNDEFTLSFSVDLVEVGVGLPTRHPHSVPKPDEYGLRNRTSSKATMYSHISIEADFSYPDQDPHKFESYRAYCDTIIDVFESEFSYEDYLDQLPDAKLLEIEEK